MLQNKKVTSEPKKAHNRYFYEREKISDALNKSGYLVTFFDNNDYKYSNILHFQISKKGNHIGNQQLPFNENKDIKIQKSQEIKDEQPVTLYYSSERDFKNEYFEGLSEEVAKYHTGKLYLYAVTDPKTESKKWLNFTLSSSPITKSAFTHLAARVDILQFLPGNIQEIHLKSHMPEKQVMDLLTSLVIEGKVKEEYGEYEVV